MFAPRINRRQRVTRCKGGDLFPLKREEAIGHHKERLGFLAHELHESSIDVEAEAQCRGPPAPPRECPAPLRRCSD
jgi:hypothetical protein